MSPNLEYYYQCILYIIMLWWWINYCALMRNSILEVIQAGNRWINYCALMRNSLLEVIQAGNTIFSTVFLNPGRVNQIICNLLIDYITDKACYEDVSYQFSFVLTARRREYLIYFTTPPPLLSGQPGSPRGEFHIQIQNRSTLA